MEVKHDRVGRSYLLNTSAKSLFEIPGDEKFFVISFTNLIRGEFVHSNSYFDQISALRILDGLIFALNIITYKNRYLMLIVMPKNVSEIMTVKIETIGLEDTAQTAARKMKEKNVSSLVVMDENDQAVGIVTERDLVTQVCCRDASSNEYIIRHIMSSPVATIDPDSTVETAASLMQQNKVKHLVVVDEKKTAGIISSSSLIKYLDRHLELDDVNAKILATALSEEPM